MYSADVAYVPRVNAGMNLYGGSPKFSAIANDQLIDGNDYTNDLAPTTSCILRTKQHVLLQFEFVSLLQSFEEKKKTSYL